MSLEENPPPFGINASSTNADETVPPPPSLAEMIDVKKQKRLMTEGTELFNRHSPQKGVEFLCEKGLLKNPLEPKV
jgi:hypothetical protein